MDRGEMRAGDADREAVADKLRGALEEGRLDLHEYDERLQRAYAAKTYGDLNGLLDDLPDTVPASRSQLAPFAPAQPAVVASSEKGVTAKWLAHTWDGYFGTVAIVVAIWAVICLMSQEWLYFWPGWVAGPWGAVLIVSTVSGLMTGEPRRWADNRGKEKLKKQAKRDRRAAEGTVAGDD